MPWTHDGPSTPLGLLTILTHSSFTSYLTIEWTLADNITATDYAISYSNIDCRTDTYDYITSISTSQTMYTVTGLEEGTDYSFTVTVTLSDGIIAVKTTTATTMNSGQYN